MLDAAREAVDFAQDGRREDLVGDRKLTLALVKDVEIKYQPRHPLEDGARRPSTACADSFYGSGRRISAMRGIQQYNALEACLVPAGLAKQSLWLRTQ